MCPELRFSLQAFNGVVFCPHVIVVNVIANFGENNIAMLFSPKKISFAVFA